MERDRMTRTETMRGAHGPSIEIGPMRDDEGLAAAAVAARAFLSTPMTAAAMGGTGDKQLRQMEKGMRAMFTRLPGRRFVARSGEDVVGAMRMVESPGCHPSGGMRVLVPLVMLATMGPGARRVMHFRGRWAKRDPTERHWHLDPLVVEPEFQGRGVGSRLLTRFSEVVDESGIGAYLETDQEANVRLYRRFGFEVVGTEDILGVTNYFMWREPRG